VRFLMKITIIILLISVLPTQLIKGLELPKNNSNIPDDSQSSYALVEYIYQLNNHKRVAVIKTNSRYGRVGTMHFQHAAVRAGHPVIIEERFDDRDIIFK